MRTRSSRDEFFEKLFARDVSELEYVHHPSEEVLRVYLRGYLSREWRDPDSLLSKLQGEAVEEWRHQEVSAHVLTCGRCRQRAHELQTEMSPQGTFWPALQGWLAALPERLAPVPRPALATMAVEFAIIVGLIGVLFFQPAPLFTKSAALGGVTSTVTDRHALPPTNAPATPQDPPTLEAAGFLPLPVTQAMQTLNQDPNPESRLAAVQSLKPYADIRLVEPLSQVLDREQHPQVRQAIVQTITFIWGKSEDQFTSVAQMMQRLRERHRIDFDAFQISIDIDLDQLRQDLNALRTRVQYPYETLCTSRPELTLGQLSGLASEFDGVLVIDRSLATGSFRLRLPLTLGAVRTIDQLESQLGIICRK